MELILKFFSMTIWTHHGGTNGLTGRKGRKRSKSPWEAPNGPKILPTGIKHNYKSFWAILGPFRHPWGPQNGPKHHPKGQLVLHDLYWPCMVKISSSGIKIVLTCITHNYMSYWTPRRSFRHPWGPQNGPKHHPNGPKWPCMAQIDPAGSKIALVALK